MANRPDAIEAMRIRLATRHVWGDSYNLLVLGFIGKLSQVVR